MVDKLVRLLIKAGVTWFPRKIAAYLATHNVVVVTHCEDCCYSREVDSPDGTLLYCDVYNSRVPCCGYCYNGR